MKYLISGIAAFLIFTAHDLFLKTEHFHLRPDTEYELLLVNGSFDKSENAVNSDRIIHPIIKGPDYEMIPSVNDWYDADNTAHLKFKTGDPGTYVAGVSTKPRPIQLSADDFNDYLKHDGVLNILTFRKEHGLMKEDATELYAKHVKAILQVGDEITHHHYSEVLDYPVEFIPVVNPYELSMGGIAEFKLLANSKTLADQLVYVGHRPFEEDHDHDEETDHDPMEYPLLTNSEGIVRFMISEKGYWYLRTIHMVPVETDSVDYISDWATLTFEID